MRDEEITYLLCCPHIARQHYCSLSVRLSVPRIHLQQKTRNLANANRSRVSCADKVTTVSK